MNIEKTLKNSVISVIGQACTLLLQFVNRRIFIIFLEIEFLGYQSLFSNIFSLLSVAELGIGNIITFHLFKELAQDNKDEIGKLMYIYKWVYRLVALIVLIVGGICYFFLPYIIKNPTQSWSYLHQIYVIQLGSIVLGYFLSYRRIIYIANQKEYQCLQIDLYTAICVQIVQIMALAIFKNYLLYIVIQLSSSLISNMIISHKAICDYPYINKRYRITKSDIRRRKLIPDIKNFLVHKLCYAIYGGTDNVIISAFCGIREVALYGNYFLLQKGIMQMLFYRMLNPVQATIGNIIYSNRPKKELWKQFQVLDVFSHFFASYIGIGFLVFFQPAIRIWMGEDYLLPFSFVVVYSATIYFEAVWEIIYKYRSVFGDYAQDRNCMIVSAVINIVISIVGAHFLGVVGVQIGTFIAFFPIAYGRIYFIVKKYFCQSQWNYIGKHTLLSGVTFCEGLLCYILTEKLNVTIMGLIMRILIWVVVPLVGNFLIYWKNPHFKEMCVYIKRIIGIMKSKIVGKFLSED